MNKEISIYDFELIHKNVLEAKNEEIESLYDKIKKLEDENNNLTIKNSNIMKIIENEDICRKIYSDKIESLTKENEDLTNKNENLRDKVFYWRHLYDELFIGKTLMEIK